MEWKTFWQGICYYFYNEVLQTRNLFIMEKYFIPVEKELALEAWMLQTFKLDDKLLQEDLLLDGWLKADIKWFELN